MLCLHNFLSCCCRIFAHYNVNWNMWRRSPTYFKANSTSGGFVGTLQFKLLREPTHFTISWGNGQKPTFVPLNSLDIDDTIVQQNLNEKYLNYIKIQFRHLVFLDVNHILQFMWRYLSNNNVLIPHCHHLK